MTGQPWCEKEEEYLRQLHDNCVMLSKKYMTLYIKTHSKQTKLRIPTIILSSCTGVASFGSTSFPLKFQKYVSIVVGIINVGIAMIQTYESYLKIGDIVSKSLSVSTSFKKLADDIYCEIFIPVEDRANSGIMFLRDCFTRYQTVLEQCPPLYDSEMEETATKALLQRISHELNIGKDTTPMPAVVFGRTPFHRPSTEHKPSSLFSKFRRSLPRAPIVSSPSNRALVVIPEKLVIQSPKESEYSDAIDHPDT